MFGHGQVEGFSEQYGMEFRRPQRDESPDEGLVERHRREIFPLLRQRWRFAGASGFRQLAAFDGGAEVPDVFAYANRAEHGPADAVERRSLVVYLNRYPRAHVRIPGVAEALGLAGDPNDFLILRDQRSGLDYLRGLDDLREHGLELSLDGYACHVFLGFEEVSDAAGAGWGELAMRIGLGGVPDAHLALRRLREEPVRAAVAAVFATRLAQEAFLPVPEGPARAPAAQAPEPRRPRSPIAGDASSRMPSWRPASRTSPRCWGRTARPPHRSRRWLDWCASRARVRPRLVAQAVAGSVLRTAIGEVACGGDRARSLEAFDDWEAAAAVGDLARRAGSSDAQAWRVRGAGARPPGRCRPGALAEAAAATRPARRPGSSSPRSARRAAGTSGRAHAISRRRPGPSSSRRWPRGTRCWARPRADAAAAELRRRAASSGYRLDAGAPDRRRTASTADPQAP